MVQHRVLQHHTILNTAKLNRKDNRARKILSLNDPAIDVMTDFSQTIPISVSAQAPIDDTNSRMINYGIRLLFVNGAENKLVGLITASDLLGEKPMQYISEHGGKHADIVTRDIMTHIENIEVLFVSDVEKATVGDIVATVKEMGRQHLLVVSQEDDGKTETIRGIFSTSRIAKQLGITIELYDKANTFTEFLEAISPN